MLKRLKWTIVLAVLLMPATAIAAVSAETLIQADVGAPVLDVTTSPEDDLAFLLTPKAVLIYSVDEKKTVDQIPLEGVYDRIAFLDSERLVLTRAKSSQIDVIRFNRIYAIDLKDRITKGPAHAPVTLVVFDDYQCPYCARLDRYIKEQILPQFPDEVRYAIKHFPLSSHPFAYEGAMAALAAGKQGKFWEFHSRLLANHNQVNETKILEIASELKLDMQQFNKDRTSEALRKKSVRMSITAMLSG
ncbi:DsbA family protein [Desulfosarcina cetonica]|uniref:DsbA family protein n=1 Tax=Desulfosarcina cetonica TaxID=90730 RepID=UPI0006D03EC7|nr:thioredoxin domain-containing protein [Desulfosarcina cetonica]